MSWNQIKSNQIKSNQIKSNQIKSNQIKSNQIKSNQITSNKINSSHTLKWYHWEKILWYHLPAFTVMNITIAAIHSGSRSRFRARCGGVLIFGLNHPGGCCCVISIAGGPEREGEGEREGGEGKSGRER